MREKSGRGEGALDPRRSAHIFQIVLKHSAELKGGPLPALAPRPELRAVQGAIDALADTARAHDVRLETRARLGDVGALVGGELAEVERALAAANGGVAPATGAAAHLLTAGGKRVRPLALLLAASCFGPVDGVARELAVVAELVHAATLLHDDVIDDGDERRGRPTARRVFGNAVSVLAGDMLLVQALRLASRAAPGPTFDELLETLGALVDGEVVQLRGRSALVADEAAYFAVVEGKTASLFRWAMRAGARAAGAREAEVDALGRYGLELGVAFQLVDDVLDYAGDAEQTGKALLADALEGKITLPLIVALERTQALWSLAERARAGDEAAAVALGDEVRASGACLAVRDRARAHSARAVSALAKVPSSRARDLLAALAEDLGARAR